MNISMLGALAQSWNDIVTRINSGNYGDWSWLSNILTPISTVLWVLLVLVGAAGSIYAVYVGVKMARAESPEQRDENKKRLINIIVSIVVVIVLILFFNWLLPMILDAFGIVPGDKYDQNQAGTGEAVGTMLNTAKVFLHM